MSAPTLYWHVRNKRQLLDLMAEALRTVLAVGNYVIGCAVEYQAEAAREPDPERDARLLAQVRETGDLPNLQAALATGAGPDPAASFEHGLGLLIAGIRARHAELVGTTAAAGTPVEAG